MTRLTKKIMSGILAAILACSCFGMTSLAMPQENDPYEAVFDAINEEYNLDLGYVKVDPAVITLEDYEKQTRELAIQQRDLLDYIDSQERIAVPEGSISTYSDWVVTRTRACVGEPNLQITVTYTYDDVTGQISNPIHGRIALSATGENNDVWFSICSGPNYYFSNSYKTLSVQFRVNIKKNNTSYSNVLEYAEFLGK